MGSNGVSFQLDSGASYTAIGENMCWCETAQETYAYDDWMGKLAAAGGNYIRLWSDLGGASTFVVEPTVLGFYDQVLAC